ncbi:large conductance mechanosensitive channel protein MscL [Allostreptomyces psammosilenae]|uniref:Large-conductance mechanosensitive channel n=1 Tax=Allostreptomyces psammosilenae TaxID=1892865 RepID=A0A853AB93_9ACTN|nr:large conductance mechanosensitive channel protein MscL [Allostreptomyces psammosilenae]NYI07768.1 large conductance mechanosensitive channel [Allostreptomyces psammosilenae]
MLKGFRDFLMRGNVIDLAVAVVIGAAFTRIVDVLVKGVINPVVGAFGSTSLDGYHWCINGPCAYSGTEVTEGVAIMWGALLGATLNFLITAAVVYFIIVGPMRRLTELRKQEKAAEATVTVTELSVLTEIRDLLAAQRQEATGELPEQAAPRP